MSWKEQLAEYEQSESWDAAVPFMEEVVAQHPDDVEVWVQWLYLLHNLLLEVHLNLTDLQHPDLEKKLLYYFKESRKRFSQNAEYLFFMGVILHVAEFYFGENDTSLAYTFSQEASKLDPENRLYRWQVLRNVHNDDDNIHAYQLANELIVPDSAERRWLESKGFPGRYVFNINLKSSAREPMFFNGRSWSTIPTP